MNNNALTAPDGSMNSLTTEFDNPCNASSGQQITVGLLRNERTRTSLTVSCDISAPSRSPQTLWYQCSADLQITKTSYNAFVIAGVIVGMIEGLDVIIEGEADPLLLANLEEYIDIWATWMPGRFSKISVQAASYPPLRPVSETATICFSGGVDACDTLLAHKEGRRGRRSLPIGLGLLIHGFDVPLDREQRFERTAADCRAILDSVNVPLLEVRTNWRDIVKEWEYTHAAGLASCLWLTSTKSGRGLIASGDTSYLTLVHGSNPFTDRLFSGSHLTISNDGGAHSRVGKVEAIKNWDAALAHLRVCWRGRNLLGNCGECEKCIRTIMNFRVVGKDAPGCFPHDVSLDQIRKLSIPDPLRMKNFQTVLREAEARGLGQEAWVKVLRTRLSKGLDHQNRPPLALRAMRRLKRELAGVLGQR